jgi:hypothetical protein
MPSPSPSKPWQGAQKMLKRSRPRSSSASVTCGGFFNAAARAGSDCGTVPSGGSCADEPFWKMSAGA